MLQILEGRRKYRMRNCQRNTLFEEEDSVCLVNYYGFTTFFASYKSSLFVNRQISGPILEFKGSVRHVQKGHPTLLTQSVLILHNR